MRFLKPGGFRPVAAAAGVSAVVGLAGIPATAAVASAEDAQHILKIAYGSTIDSFNPFIAIYQGPFEINGLVYEHLVQTSEVFSPGPALHGE